MREQFPDACAGTQMRGPVLTLTAAECRLIGDVLWVHAKEAYNRDPDRERASRLKDLSTKMHNEASRLEGRC